MAKMKNLHEASNKKLENKLFNKQLHSVKGTVQGVLQGQMSYHSIGFPARMPRWISFQVLFSRHLVH